MMDELDLKQFKDLVGDLGDSGKEFDLDDIIKDYGAELPEEQTAPLDDPAGQPEEVIVPQPETDREDAVPFDAEEELPADEPLYTLREEEDTEEKEEKAGLLSRLFQPIDDEEEEPIEDEVFEEKKPKSGFWKRWMTSVSSEQPDVEEELSEAEEAMEPVTSDTVVFRPQKTEQSVDEEALQGETIVFSMADADQPEQETVLMDKPEDQPEQGTVLMDKPEDQPEREPVRMDEPEVQAQQDSALLEEEERETALLDEAEETEEMIEAQEEQTRGNLAEQFSRIPNEEFTCGEDDGKQEEKPSFWKRWFTPIEPEEQEGEAEEAETVEKEDEGVQTEEPPQEQPDIEPLEEIQPTISEEEFEAFLREADQPTEKQISFESIIGQSRMEEQPSSGQTEADDLLVPGDAVVDENNMQTKVVIIDLSEGQKEDETEPDDQPELTEESGQFEAEMADIEEEADEEKEAELPPKLQPRQFKEPEWIHLPIDQISEIAPVVERRNGEPVLMSELRHLNRKRERALQSQQAAARPEPVIPSQPQHEPAQSETASEDGGDDEVSGGQPGNHDQWDGLTKATVETPDYSEKYSLLEDGSKLEESEYAEEELEFRSVPEPEAIPVPDLTEPEQPEIPETLIEPAKEMVKQEVEKVSERKQRRMEKQKAKEEKMKAKRQVPKTAKLGMKACNRDIRLMKRQSVVIAVLTLLSLYLSCSTVGKLPVPRFCSYADSPQWFFGVLIGLTLLSMLIAMNIIADGLRSAFSFQIDFNSLVTLSLVVSIVHCAVLMTRTSEELPYPSVAMAALFALIRARSAQQTARRNTYKAAAMNQTPVGIFLRRTSTPYLVKRRLENSEAFVYSAAKDGWCSRFERLYSPIAIVVAIVLAGIVTAATGEYGRFLYALSALFVASCQIGLLTAVAFGCAGATKRLLRDDAAIAGMTAVVGMSDVSQVVMEEDDLFPAGAILVDDYIDLRGKFSEEEALAYAAAIGADSALGKVLREKLRTKYIDLAAVHNPVRYANSGKGGIIAGQEVLFGTAALMNDRKIPIPALANEDEAMFLAVDGVLQAIFEVEYIATTQVYTALQLLADRRIAVLFQARDCHLSPERLSDLFGLKPGMIRIPDPEQAHELSRPDDTEEDDLLAILTRDGAAPYSDCVDTACVISRFTWLGLVLGLIAAALDFALMSYLCYVFAPLGASPLRVLLYSILWAIPIFFIENETRRG